MGRGCLVLAAAMAWGCHGDSPTRGAEAAGPAAVAPPAPAAVRVAGNEGRCDLGPVAPGSRHVVTFLLENPSEEPLTVQTARGDCSCIRPLRTPGRIAPHASAEVSAEYTAPSPAVDYETRLIVVTDRPARRLIHLKVTSRPPAP